MKISTVLLVAGLASCNAECATEMEFPIQGSTTKISFSGFEPNVQRITNTGVGNKVVLKSFERKPSMDQTGDTLSITAGDPCDGSVVLVDSSSDSSSGDEEESSASKILGFSVPFLAAKYGGAGSGILSLAVAAGISASGVSAQTAECQIVPIDVEIYLDTTADEIVMREAQSGDFETCPPETLYWKHHPKLYGGYEGCVGEKAYYPCAVDSQGVWEEDGALAAKYPTVWDGESCVDTGYTTETRTYWILWGDPLDKYELNTRTGLNPVVSFPFNRGPYPRYTQGGVLGTDLDDSADAQLMAKDLLVYIGAFTEAELEDYDVTFTEGAESGMVSIWAGKALDIARTTCNRNIFALMEVPAYGYTPSDSADLVNKHADTFYNSSECLCFETDSCKDPTVTIENRGWLPLTDFPSEMGGDGEMYAANSNSAASPWFESMVFPENPSGKIKTTQLSDANRRVCDGVYLWPMYFGMRDYVIPMDERPDCSAWSFSITKAYSASVRAGFIMYKKDEDNKAAMVDTVSDLYSMTHGLYSEWSWYGQMQLWEMIMSKPIDDPTSWIGAYSEIMDEKWTLIIDAFADCPVVSVSNPKAGAYAWFVYKAPYVGIQGGFVSSFFRDVLGVRTTTYNWGFRGANPADFYGDGYTTTDFTRLQLYRDISVYEEVARRAKIVCDDPDAVVGDFISVNQWAAGQGTTARRLTGGGYSDMEERKRHLMEFIPDLEERQLDYLAASHESSDIMDRKAQECAPYFNTDCLFNKVGARFEDY